MFIVILYRDERAATEAAKVKFTLNNACSLENPKMKNYNNDADILYSLLNHKRIFLQRCCIPSTILLYYI